MKEEFNEFSPSVGIAYIGKKPMWRDTMFRSNTTFYGTFDVQIVDGRIASRLLRFKDCFILAEQLDEYKKALAESLKRDAEKAAQEPQVAEEEKADFGLSHDPVLIEKIKTAIMALDQNNESHFKNGRPLVPAVRAHIGGDDAKDVTSKAVSEAFNQLNAGN